MFPVAGDDDVADDGESINGVAGVGVPVVSGAPLLSIILAETILRFPVPLGKVTKAISPLPLNGVLLITTTLMMFGVFTLVANMAPVTSSAPS